MGIEAIREAMACATAETSGALKAFHAELLAAEWRSAEEVAAAYPDAAINEDRMVVPFDERHTLAVIFNFKRGIALIECAERHAAARSTKRKRA